MARPFLWFAGLWLILAAPYLLFAASFEEAFTAIGLVGRSLWVVLEVVLHAAAVWFAIGIYGAFLFMASGIFRRRSLPRKARP
ncbi:MAG: hypothetical protein CMM46_14310 [Rhodospirillaceae bacterium]|nr:hypothetical protein [Rhodospirillaceae bacterium]|tara:strand:+ start:3983 stop:4231 length:249 start_codon:yes stop_codon:yes gene_type:complete